MPRGATGQRAVTRARLLESAAEMFAERGFHGTSIELICERAGFSRGAFYSNFASKDELFFAMFDAHAGTVLTRLRGALEEAAASENPIHRFAATVSRQAQDRQWFLITTEFTLYAVRNPDAARTLAAHDEAVRAELSTILVELLRLAGRASVVDPALLARFAVALREGGDAQAYVEPDDADARAVERLFLPAVLTAFSQEL